MAQDDTKPSERSVGDPLDEAHRIIDCEIARLGVIIQSLKSRRNKLSPIYRLPPEVLCNIFSFIEDCTLAMVQVRSPEHWIKFSRVSQQWRSLALSTPELWTNIPVQYPRWAEEMLARSKMAKLTMQVGLRSQSMNSRVLNPVKSCLSQMIRLEEIDILGAPESTLKQFFQDIPKSAPQLKTLRVDNATVVPTSFLSTAFTIPDDFLSDTARLRCVQLKRCKIGWDCRILTGLTRLTLHDSLKDHSNSSIIPFLHALQQMPALTHLDLEDSIPDHSGELSTYPIADLPCLRVLRILLCVVAMTAVLAHITFPSKAQLILICIETQPESQFDFSTFLSVLAPKILSSLVIQSLSLEDLDVAITWNGFRVKVWSTTPGPHFFRYSSSQLPPLELVLRSPTSFPSYDAQKYAKALTATFDAMDLHALIQLEVSTSYHIDSKTWLKTFARLSRLEWVRVTSSVVRSFINALVHKSQAANTSIAAYRTVSFPGLRRICMDNNLGEPNLGGISVNELLDCLMERYERNAEVQELYLERCYDIRTSEVERLREIVVHLGRNRVERFYRSEEK
ncbi:hypothetical protein BYT27DRAFT_7258583 [Phlegmacium glaucopus]|nr:hypothetical protein BYT27DRAFT_7258583 [Phlegmacium glaucopus]